ncbi:hypothetical protein BOTBODRAFT_39282 [Botryobasidium botryosum FD-172 SS1]|uniref:Protein kinase domain-containing protein n=1 Tax=Botryobasidium botryosum (strain FD-172 SS1) TaxID=930990 RepID=A0A067LUT1_BOTB1|nr:hypothetical protein BOTBODRAFT_39282 [Botryobasidium botryosum FD-172 SS1]
MDLSGTVHKLDEQPVAHGGFSDIYRGILVKTPRALQVAIKVIVTRGSSRETDGRIQRRLAREIITWENLDHPGVIKLLGICSGFGRFSALISPWYNNGNVSEYLKTHPNANRLNLLRGVIAAIDYLHALQPPVVHGDIKAANVLITDDGEACLGDFGLSRFIESVSTGLTTTSPLGTPRWMAPELFFPIKDEVTPVTTEGDIYASGCLAIEILTDQWPWYDIQSDREVMLKVHEGQISPRPEGELAARELTDELWELITSCWSYKPSERPQATAVHRKLLFITGAEPPDSQDGRHGLPSPAEGTVLLKISGVDLVEVVPAQDVIADYVSSSSAASSPTPSETRLSGISLGKPALHIRSIQRGMKFGWAGIMCVLVLLGCQYAGPELRVSNQVGRPSGLGPGGLSPSPPPPSQAPGDTLRPTPPPRPSEPETVESSSASQYPKHTLVSDGFMWIYDTMLHRLRRMSPPDDSQSPEEIDITDGIMKIHDDVRLVYDHKISSDEFRRNVLLGFKGVMGNAFEMFLTQLDDSDSEEVT